MACAVAPRPPRMSPGLESSRARAVAGAVKEGPEAMTVQQKLYFLADSVALSQLHEQVQSSPGAHPAWFADRIAEETGLREAS